MSNRIKTVLLSPEPFVIHEATTKTVWEPKWSSTTDPVLRPLGEMGRWRYQWLRTDKRLKHIVHHVRWNLTRTFWPVAERFAFWLLEKAGCKKVVETPAVQTAIYSQTFDLDKAARSTFDGVMAYLRMSHEYQNTPHGSVGTGSIYTAANPRYILVGPRQLADIAIDAGKKYPPSSASRLFGFPQDHFAGLRPEALNGIFQGAEVILVPWLDGVLPLPDLEELRSGKESPRVRRGEIDDRLSPFREQYNGPIY